MKIQFPDEYLAELWETTDWAKAKDTLASLQKKLAYAAYARDSKRIVDLQKKIVRCSESKLLAVRHVCNSSSGPGIDGVRWTRPEQKMQAALSLTSDGYHAKPLREIIVHSKTTGKDRRYGLPTYYDRAMQVLYSYSLAPVTEATADRKSFAYRLGRSMQDVGAYIMDALTGDDAPNFVVIADVQAHFATIQHSWLMAQAPMDKKILHEFLGCGHVFAGELFPSDDIGISLGANLSPLLGNFTLDGLQKHIYDCLYPSHAQVDYANGNMIRWADDIFITVRSEQVGERVLLVLADFLSERGLRLSQEKCRIVNIKDGVTFLSRTYKKKDGIVRSMPSVKAIARKKSELRELILTHKKSQRSLITLVNSKLRGWSEYHRYSDANAAFREIDSAVQAFLLQAAIARHPKMQREKLLQRYWYRDKAGRRVYALQDEKESYIIPLADTILLTHNKVATNKNYYIDTDYFEMREHQKSIERVTSDFRPIWLRQNGRCYYCDRPILQDQQRALVQIDLLKPPSKRNMAYVHLICKPNQFSQYDTEDDVTAINDYEILQILNEVNASKHRPKHLREKGEIDDTWKHINLKRYFAATNAAYITLSFSQIEEIDGLELPPTAERSDSYWYPRTTCNTIAEAWLTEGYKMIKLDRDKRTVRFKRSIDGMEHIQIPKWLTDEKIPSDARFELESFFEYIKKRYGL